MIVFGADAHKRSHTLAAVSATTGELLGEKTVQVGAKGFAALLTWARGLAGEHFWIWSSPAKAANHAKQIRRYVARCPHHD